MQQTTYDFAFYTPDGELVFFITGYHKANFWVKEQEIGSLTLDLPYVMIPDMLPYIAEDCIIEIYKSDFNGKILMFNKRWFLKLWRDKVDEKGVKFLRLIAQDCNHLAEKRIIAYDDETSYTQKQDMPADDMIKEFARENFGSSCTDTTRDWSDKIEIEENQSAAPDVSIDGVEKRLILPVLQEICQKSEAAGTYLTFNVIWRPDMKKYLFYTRIDALESDRGSLSQMPI